MNVVIEITKSHIDKGVKHSPNQNPAALALKDMFGADRNIYVALEYMSNGKEVKITPWRIKTFLNRFNLGNEVKPYNFWWKS